MRDLDSKANCQMMYLLVNASSPNPCTVNGEIMYFLVNVYSLKPLNVATSNFVSV